MTTLLRLAFAFALLMMVCEPAFSVERGFVPSQDEITSLEKAIRLPGGARALGEYLRFYAGKFENGKHRIVAVLILNPSKAGIRIVDLEHLPNVSDGGCSIVDAQYEVESRSFSGVTCHGVA